MINNPFLHEAKKLVKEYDLELCYEYKELEISNVFFNILDYFSGAKNEFMVKRQELRKKYAHAIPNDKAIQTICKYSPIVEVGSGTGYWANLISKQGAEISCIETEEYCYYEIEDKAKYYPASMINSINDCFKVPENFSMLMVWPPAGTNNDGSERMAYNYLKNYHGNTFLYVGENQEGSCGNTQFFELINNQYKLEEIISIPAFPDIYDGLFVYKKKIGQYIG